MHKFATWVAALLLMFAVVAPAQTSESLFIGPGDAVHIQVFDTPELEQHARVTDAGSIQLLLGGSVDVNGLTPVDAARAIEKTLLTAGVLKSPRVTVSIEDYATQKVTLMGEVKAPGNYALKTPLSINEVLQMAGGITENADRNIVVQHRNNTEKFPYYVSNDPNQALTPSLVIRPGDTIFVPKAGIVYVIGDVSKPGGYIISDNHTQITALQLVARAGGTNHSAVPSHARLIRKSATGYTETPIELSKMQKGKTIPDLTLAADDIVYVPFSYLRNFALGASSIAATVGGAAVYHF